MNPEALTDDVVITGAAAVTSAPRAPGAPSGAGLQPARWAGAPARLARMDRLCALALTACDACLIDGALAPLEAAWDADRTAVVLGTAFGCHATNEEFYRGLLAGGVGAASPRLFAYTLPSSPVGEIAIHYQARGPGLTLASGLAAGVEALAWGLRLLRAGRADRALVIAAEVATPLLGRLRGAADNGLTNSPTSDQAAALLLERAAGAASRGVGARARLLDAATNFAAGDPESARSAAIRALLHQRGAEPAPLILDGEPGAPRANAGERRGTGGRAAASAAAPLIEAIAWLAAPAGRALVVAGDPAGAGAAALLAVED